jgi:hypothetical protein
MMQKCPVCHKVIRTGELVQLLVIAPYHELASSVTFSIGLPIDSDPSSLAHAECEEADEIYEN